MSINPIGTVVAMPERGSNFFIVRDEFGNGYSVPSSNLPSGIEDGDEFAYRVEITGGSSYTATTLQALDR